MHVTSWVRGWDIGVHDRASYWHKRIGTLEELWDLVHAKFEGESDGESPAVLEISANVDASGEKCFVLTWVELAE